MGINFVSPPPVPSKAWQPYSFGKLAKNMAPHTSLVVKGATVAATAGALGLLAALIVKKMTLQRSISLPGVGGAPASGASSGRRPHDPYTDHDFHLVIDGIDVGAFQKFDGLSWECDVIEYKDSMDHFPHKRPGLFRFGNIKFTKGVIQNTALYDWCKRVQNGEIDRRNGALQVLDRTNDNEKPVLVYEFFGAYPTKWSSFRLDGKGSATMLEDIELAVDRFTIKK